MENPHVIVRGLKSGTVALLCLLSLGVGIGIGISVQRTLYPCVELKVETTVRDTIVVTDTVLAPIPQPVVKPAEKRETIKIEFNRDSGKFIPSDTTIRVLPQKVDSGAANSSPVQVELPRQRLEYKTDQYRAVVSGYRPALDEMELYPQTKVVTETVTKIKEVRPRWVLSAGVGGGYDGDRVRPHIGLTFGFALWSGR